MKIKRLLVGALALGVGCQQDVPTAPVASPGTMVPPGTVQVIIAQEPSMGRDSSVFLVRLVANGVPLAAYQGSVTFAPGSMDILGIITPESGDGAFRIVNGEGASSGKLRFAGFSAEATAATDVFRIVARLHGPVAAAKLDGALDIAGEASGTQIIASSLLRSTGVYDAATNVQLVP